MTSLDMVAEFSRAFGYSVLEVPTAPPGNSTLLEHRERLATHIDTVARVARSHAEDTGDVCALRLSLILEELAELAEAFAVCAPVAIFDALLDLRYVNDGTVHACGMGQVFAEGMRRVHVSNMSKLGPDGTPIYDAAGKAVKGPFYEPPRLGDLVHGRVR